MLPEAGILDHLGRVKSQSVRRKHEHIDSHYASKTKVEKETINYGNYFNRSPKRNVNKRGIASSKHFQVSILYLRWIIVQSKSPGTLSSPNSIRNIGFMPYK